MKALPILVVSLLAISSVAAPPPLPSTPAAPTDLLYARQFTVEEPFQFGYAQGAPPTTTGTIVVLTFDPALLYPRDTAEPVLYAGSAIAHRANLGYPSGRLIAILPGAIDLAATPIWLGTPALPESIDAAAITVERRRAAEAGIHAFAPALAVRAAIQGGEPLRLPSFAALSPWLEALVQEFADDERGESFTR